MGNEKSRAEIDIDWLNEDQLIQLNHRIVERLKFIRQMRAHGAMMKFNRGQRVRFRDREGEWVHGVLAKYNRKTVTVISDQGGRWNVSPQLLESLAPAQGNGSDTNVIEIAAARKK